MDCFSELHILIRNASQEHFAYVPIDPPTEILKKIPRGIPQFLDNTAVSRELRAAYIQHYISKILTYRIFYPFIFTLGQIDKEDTASQILSTDTTPSSVHHEPEWRQQTLKAVYSTSDATKAINTVVGTVQDEIMDHIKHFADPHHLDDLILRLRRIIELAAETWRHARIERLVIVATMPSIYDVRDDEWEEYTCGRRIDYREASDSDSDVLLGLFPHIYREAAIENFGHDTEKLNPCVYSRGMVLLSNSPSVLARINELAGKNHLP